MQAVDHIFDGGLEISQSILTEDDFEACITPTLNYLAFFVRVNQLSLADLETN
jgi:hypothetical protein